MPEHPDIGSALQAAYGAGLFHSRDRLALERRRFAALRAAAREHLWLSAPALDLDGGRPLLPGALLLELASERSGHRVGDRDPALRPYAGFVDPAHGLHGGVA